MEEHLGTCISTREPHDSGPGNSIKDQKSMVSDRWSRTWVERPVERQANIGSTVDNECWLVGGILCLHLSRTGRTSRVIHGFFSFYSLSAGSCSCISVIYRIRNNFLLICYLPVTARTFLIFCFFRLWALSYTSTFGCRCLSTGNLWKNTSEPASAHENLTTVAQGTV